MTETWNLSNSEMQKTSGIYIPSMEVGWVTTSPVRAKNKEKVCTEWKREMNEDVT